MPFQKKYITEDDRARAIKAMKRYDNRVNIHKQIRTLYSKRVPQDMLAYMVNVFIKYNKPELIKPLHRDQYGKFAGVNTVVTKPKKLRGPDGKFIKKIPHRVNDAEPTQELEIAET